MKKQIGIWLDYKEANIISLTDNNKEVLNILSEIEDYHLKGGARSKTPYGPMDVTSEKNHMERRKNQIEKYYLKIMKLVDKADEVFIMGPAEAKIGLRKKMNKTNTFKPIIKGFETRDSITENQKIALTRQFFGHEIKRFKNTVHR